MADYVFLKMRIDEKSEMTDNKIKKVWAFSLGRRAYEHDYHNFKTIWQRRQVCG